MLHTYLAEQEEQQVRLKQQHEQKNLQDLPKAKTRDASIQSVPIHVQGESADAASFQWHSFQWTVFNGNAMQQFKEQVLNLENIVSELMSYKSQTQADAGFSLSGGNPQNLPLVRALSITCKCPEAVEKYAFMVS